MTDTKYKLDINTRYIPFGIASNSGYGYRRGFGRFDDHWHRGYDFMASQGTPLPAAAAGEVVYVGWSKYIE